MEDNKELSKDIIKAKRPSKRRRIPAKIVGSILVIGFAILAFFGIKAIGTLGKVIIKNQGSSAPFLKLPKITSEALAGEGDGRVNILLIGIGGKEYRKGGNLADTIIVASIDPENKKLALLSVPRDLLVPLPAPFKGQEKINAVHSYGEQNSKQFSGGGPELLKKTVSSILDLPIHYFVRIDFNGFEKIISEVGGVDVVVEKDIYDPFYPKDNSDEYQTFQLKAGKQKLDGKTALKYARSRKTTSDFDRAKRQQELLSAYKDKALSLGFLLNPKKMVSTLNIVGDHIRTDLQTKELERVLTIIKDVKTDQIVNKVLDSSPEGLLNSINDGGYYLVPAAGNFKEVQKLAHEIFTDPYIEKENAKIIVLNGSDIAGQANDVAKQLQTYNYNVVKVDIAPEKIDKSIIYDNSNNSKNLTLQLIKKRLNINLQSEFPESLSKFNEADIIIIIGKNYDGGKKTL